MAETGTTNLLPVVDAVGRCQGHVSEDPCGQALLVDRRTLGKVRAHPEPAFLHRQWLEGVEKNRLADTAEPGEDEVGKDYVLVQELEKLPSLLVPSGEIRGRVASPGTERVPKYNCSFHGVRLIGDLLYHNYPGQDYDDLISGVDAVIERGYIDENNLFVTGGSAGGIMTAWIVGKTDRFRAAVSQKPVVNWISKTLTADNW